MGSSPEEPRRPSTEDCHRQILALVTQHRSDNGSVTVEDLQSLRIQDVIAAVREACAEKHVPMVL
jgi:hypothetical protein